MKFFYFLKTRSTVIWSVKWSVKWDHKRRLKYFDFSTKLAYFHKRCFVKRYELTYEEVWNESRKAEFILFSSQIGFYFNMIMAAYDDGNLSDLDTALDLDILLQNHFHNWHMLTLYSLLPSQAPVTGESNVPVCTAKLHVWRSSLSMWQLDASYHPCSKKSVVLCTQHGWQSLHKP